MSVFRLEKIADARFPTRFGAFRIFGFVGHFGDHIEEAVVLVMGELTGQPPLVRIHSQCLTGDVFHSLRCDCRDQLEMALERIAADGRGILLYEHQEGRGIGIMNKLRAYALQDQGADTIEANEQLGFAADLRNYELPVAILQYFGLRSVRFMSNNPEKIAALEAGGIAVAERVPMVAEPVAQRDFYLKTKRDRMGHLLAEELSEPPIA
jgi:GTP cyclohydrolase II